ncbi:hypothetical protein L1987_30680 [Smallanthus sonchifolius]|uniref:Uncharacterized protein n=1 Tax=Smallanthus sonchifolius TaxID=185202 RepID=A0ACB9I3I0_9ASTR|nr:hypothetical protein L1987_30680 [Smallanthus sonchifolius]
MQTPNQGLCGTNTCSNWHGGCKLQIRDMWFTICSMMVIEVEVAQVEHVFTALLVISKQEKDSNMYSRLYTTLKLEMLAHNSLDGRFRVKSV